MGSGSAEEYMRYEAGSEELVAKLVEDHQGWAASIARSVARAWNLDWQLDGLDGGAYEGLIFSARRYDPARGVPFRAYARRRIHESSTEEARKSKSWQRGVGADAPGEQESREISAMLFNVFPELREGLLPASAVEKGEEESMRSSVRQLLASASMLATLHELEKGGADRAIEYKRMIGIIADLEPVHQAIMWSVYWEGQSMRQVASDWGIDELNVIREHKQILQFVFSKLANPKKGSSALKIRPGLRPVAQTLKREGFKGPFSDLLEGAAVFLLVLAAGLLLASDMLGLLV